MKEIRFSMRQVARARQEKYAAEHSEIKALERLGAWYLVGMLFVSAVISFTFLGWILA